MVRAGPGEKVITVVIARSLYERFSQKAKEMGFQTDSELIRHLIRQYALADTTKGGDGK